MEFNTIIHSVTRQDLIDSGDLIEVPSPLSKQAGFKIPVALTRSAWVACVEWPDTDPTNDETGRLWDVLMLAMANAQLHKDDREFPFDLHCLTTNQQNKVVKLICHCGPDDTAEPCITIGFPEDF